MTYHLKKGIKERWLDLRIRSLTVEYSILIGSCKFSWNLILVCCIFCVQYRLWFQIISYLGPASSVRFYEGFICHFRWWYLIQEKWVESLFHKEVLTDHYRISCHFCAWQWSRAINSMAPGRFEWNSRLEIFKLMLIIDGWSLSLLWNCSQMMVIGPHWW